MNRLRVPRTGGGPGASSKSHRSPVRFLNPISTPKGGKVEPSNTFSAALFKIGTSPKREGGCAQSVQRSAQEGLRILPKTKSCEGGCRKAVQHFTEGVVSFWSMSEGGWLVWWFIFYIVFLLRKPCVFVPYRSEFPPTATGAVFKKVLKTQGFGTKILAHTLKVQNW